MQADNAFIIEHSAPSIPLRAGPDEVYDRVAQVGEGTYGQVFKAKSDKTGITVALKKIRMESERDGFPITALREVKLLQGLKHENVVRLHEMMLSKHSIYMVFEYLQHDLNGILAQPSITFSPAHIKSLAAQLLSGLAYLHKHRILHRDLKCSNLLLNNEGTLKLADFGLARTYVKQTRPSARNKTLDYTNRVVTLWYRAPELLFGETSYDDAIDVWGAGCIFLELFLRKPIFQGMDEIHQVQLLFEILGPVSKDEWPEAERLPWFDLIRPASNDGDGTLIKSHKEHLRNLVGSEEQVPDDALEVALALLTYNPRKRVSAVEGLALSYFTTNSPPAEKPAALLQAVQGEWHEFESRKARRDAAAQALQDHVHREKEQQRIRSEIGQPQMSDKVTITPSTQEPVQDTTMSSIATPTMIIDEALQRKEEREASA
ncbi:Pkinase-domain-containing protein [Meira miltonrushii]|uniref:cyclin-dependent kinase n=1 Tax=Meira miltonrushii TaxID=1280837 RepID=A0A316VGQ0_9BASI|nr:Pkinase-domain-containing protein [Meira miltonrushii]PWN36716.1 Pkinase-domain-containing protein [Meira miltonrushii]